MAQLAELVDDLRLAALQVADEVPAERVAVARVLRLEILRTVLADDLDSGVGQEPASSSTRTYFVATTTVTPAPTSADLRVALAQLVRRRRQ